MAIKTDHSATIKNLRELSGQVLDYDEAGDLTVAADLLELHDRQSLSLDEWDSAREFVERRAGITVEKNGA